MGCDPRAKLFYGIPVETKRLDEYGDEIEDSEEIDLDDLTSKWKYIHVPKPEDRSDIHSPEWDAWREKIKEWEKTPSYIDDGIYGYDDELKSYICSGHLLRSAEWDEIIALGKSLPEPPQAYRNELKVFCDEFNIPWQEPQWYLVSLYF